MDARDRCACTRGVESGVRHEGGPCAGGAHGCLAPVAMGFAMTNAEIAAVFEQIADLLEFQGENPFRVRAYRNAARSIHDLAEPAAGLIDSGEHALTDIPGIGKTWRRRSARWCEPVRCPSWRNCCAEVPSSVLAMLRVPGLGPKRAKTLYDELGVTTLEAAPRGVRVAPRARAEGVRREDGGGDPPGHRPGRPGRSAHVLGRGR